ncbi:MAG: hypothetical protein R2724_24080 [Bryobacterales bacterium]
MPPPRQLELIPLKRRSAEELRALIRQRLEGFALRQRAREDRRRAEGERRRTRGETPAGEPQVTLEEMIARLGD